jgi:hypothetical protein
MSAAPEISNEQPGTATAGGDRVWRSLGFLLLVLGFGLRLDTDWQGLALCLIVAGALSAAAGLWMLAQHRGGGAFVSSLPRE